MDSKITKILMDSGADSMIPNIANKESAFHYCGQSGNAAVSFFGQNCLDFFVQLFCLFALESDGFGNNCFNCCLAD